MTSDGAFVHHHTVHLRGSRIWNTGGAIAKGSPEDGDGTTKSGSIDGFRRRNHVGQHEYASMQWEGRDQIRAQAIKVGASVDDKQTHIVEGLRMGDTGGPTGK